MFNFTKKRVLITAGSYGLGRAMVDSFLAAGAQVSTCSRKPLEHKHAQLHSAIVDLTDTTATQAWVKESIIKMGGLDAVVFNPPHSVKVPVAQMSLEDWQKSFNALYATMIATVNEAMPALIASGSGSVVVISSIAAIEPIDVMPASSVLRGGVAAWVKLMTREFGPKGVRFNAVMPGFTDSPAVRKGFENRAKQNGKSAEELIAEFSQTIPLKRMGKPKELANAVVFLSSDLASYITGTTLLVDGGASRGV